VGDCADVRGRRIRLGARCCGIFDPRTYIEDVPFAALARFRRQHGVVCGSTSRPC